MVIKKLAEKNIEGTLQKTSFLEGRPPVVVVLGHVDHGKTTLISKIYEKDLTKKEFGGISQHIGAYQINYQGKKITFIDTPGHVAFSKMRSRGARVADLAILVVAANEGVKPQTLESLKHIQEAEIPFIVAINKIDLPDVNLEWVKKNLAENGILIEEWGGNVVAIPISAKTGQGIDELLEMIILLGEMAELKANPCGELEAVVIESKLDSRKGIMATILVRDGSLKIGDKIVAEDIQGKIKAMVNDKGEKVKIAFPGEAVEVLGFTQTPSVGATVRVVSPQISYQETQERKKEFKPEVSLKDNKKLKIILKTDVRGTLEAILESLGEEVMVVFADTGDINESDVSLAATTGAQIIGFNVKASSSVEKFAEGEKVEIKTYKIIYELLEDLENKILKILEPTIDEEILGKAQIVAEFIVKNQRVAGCRVQEGEIDKQNPLHLKRGENIVGDCRIVSMKRGKLDIEKAKKGEEFGVILSDNIDFKVGDMLLSYRKLPQ